MDLRVRETDFPYSKEAASFRRVPSLFLCPFSLPLSLLLDLAHSHGDMGGFQSPGVTTQCTEGLVQMSSQAISVALPGLSTQPFQRAGPEGQ